MIHVFADVVEIIVLAAGADALLRIDGTLKLGEVTEKINETEIK